MALDGWVFEGKPQGQGRECFMYGLHSSFMYPHPCLHSDRRILHFEQTGAVENFSKYI